MYVSKYIGHFSLKIYKIYKFIRFIRLRFINVVELAFHYLVLNLFSKHLGCNFLNGTITEYTNT